VDREETKLRDENSLQAVQHLADAHETLWRLRHRVTDFQHREALDQALRKLEAALNVLAVKTGGLL
jgi:hypothetical protein